MIELPNDMSIAWDWWKEFLREEAKLEPELERITKEYDYIQKQRMALERLISLHEVKKNV